jgi:pyruvate dehydrogenase E2 component (dihydrolipoamide acetyltransferase)
MATEIRLPVLGENVDSATIVKILVHPGDTITKDQPIAELDTEKASVELPASEAGTVKDIQVKEGETIKVGQVILTLNDTASTPERVAEKESPPPKPQEPVRPPQAEPEAAKQNVQPKPRSEPEPESERESEPEPEPEPEREPQPETEAIEEVAAAAPSIRRMARELGIDIHAVKGTGPDGRISKDDVRNFARSIILNASAAGFQPESAELPDFSRWGEIERKAMTPIRRKTAEHVQDAWSSIPHVTQFDSADISELEKLRETYAKRVEDAGGKLTITAIVLKAASAALKVFPQFNVSLDAARGEIIFKKYCHIGIAVDTEHGLLVPVIRDVDRKNILELSVELTRAGKNARSRKLSIEDMQGGTFTITNLGGIGGTYFTPIVNSPEVAILGMSRASLQAVSSNGEFKPRLILPLSLSYDHRAIDGAAGARFLRWIAEALEKPFMLSLEG